MAEAGQEKKHAEARSFSPEAIRKIVTKGRETRIRNLLNKAKNKGLTEIERKWLRSLQEKSESP